MTLAALVVAFLLPHAPAPAWTVGWAVLRGVDPGLALAIDWKETGHIRGDARRDRARGPGGVGRRQVNPVHWRSWGYGSRAAFEAALHEPLVNARVSSWYLAECWHRLGRDARRAAECYNGSGGRAAFGRDVVWYLRRLRPGRTS
jgi:hypothetical protein